MSEKLFTVDYSKSVSVYNDGNNISWKNKNINNENFAKKYSGGEKQFLYKVFSNPELVDGYRGPGLLEFLACLSEYPEILIEYFKVVALGARFKKGEEFFETVVFSQAVDGVIKLSLSSLFGPWEEDVNFIGIKEV